ncbi:Metallo-dependent phosphatase-like protein [Umbelopsis sp. PMI_123]|nr:Metallo-dependent phosphatase-like protein [Umbelopsis sp. PMI_123]
MWCPPLLLYLLFHITVYPCFQNTSVFSHQDNDKVHSPHKQAKFLHITDLHVDPYYKIGSKTSTACHLQSKKSKNPDKIAGPVGDRACDSPMGLVKATFNWIRNHHGDDIDFVVWTGDNARYSIPIIPTFGNNDIYPHNILYGGAKGKKVFERFLDIWAPFIPKDQHETFLEGGYFAVDVIPKHLRVISLNSMYLYNSNAAVDSCSKKSSPGRQQLEWLHDQLHQAKKEDTKVIIIGHVPPISSAYYKSCRRHYSKLALQYDDIISGHLYGHLNMDHFLILGDDDATKGSTADDEAHLADDSISMSRNVPKYLNALRQSYRSVNYVNDGKTQHAVINISPSVIPEMNPTFRIFRYESDVKASNIGDLYGYTQWYANLTYWNQHQPKYQVEYDTLKDYDMKDLSTDSWLDLAHDLSGEGHASEKCWNNYIYRMFVQSKDLKDLV